MNPKFALFGFIGGIAFMVIFSMIFSHAGLIYAIGYFLMFSAISLTYNAIQGIAGGFTEQLKISELTNSKKGIFVKMFIVAAVVGIISAFIFALPAIYKTDAISTNPHYLNMSHYLSQYTDHWFNSESLSGWSDLKLFSGILRFGIMGIGITFFLMFMTGRFLWWPLHPIGYVLGGGHRGTTFGGSFLVTWIIKLLILRWGGANLYKKLAPFFKGLIAGTMVMDVLWGIVGVVVGR